MWIADKIYYQDSSGYTRAYQGSELVWERPSGERYITFTAKQAQSTVGLNRISDFHTMMYSTDGFNWSTMTSGTTITLNNSGDSVYVRGILSAEQTYSGYTNFTTSGNLKLSGNINYLWNYQNVGAALYSDCGFHMFDGCTALTDASELVLSSTTLADYCYAFMFQGCTNLVNPPQLPSTTLAAHCYDSMFDGCISLTTAPVLPATTLATGCYREMFWNCTSLTTAPVLPVTTLATSCYLGMFAGCESLTTAPELPATTLTNSCYWQMFLGCWSLTTAPELPATTLTDSCYYEMFKNCISLTTAPELPATTLADSCYQRMFYGCTKITTAPVLPAPTLVQECYYEMFGSCLRLNYIKCLATNKVVTATQGWVRNVAATGTFVKDASMTGWTIDSINGIPSGWTVQDDGIDFTKKHWWHGTYQFELPTRWNNNYYLEFDYYGTVTASTSNVTIINQTNNSPIELRLYQRGFYFDMHYPNSTTNATVNSTDYDKRIMKSSGINTAYDGRKCTMRLCCGTTARAKIVDISGTTILDQTTSVASQSYCTTKDYVFKFVAPYTPVPDWHSSDLRIYDNDDTLIHNFQLYQNPNSNNDYQYYDRITETWYPNINSSGVITDVTTTNR